MIRIKKPPTAPDGLVNLKAPADNELEIQHGNAQPLSFSKGVYAHKSVKSALRKAQHAKCAYCEKSLIRSHVPVEHFRPKDGWKQNRANPLQKPGYFWLAYDWSNLLLSCAVCNDQGHKGNLFPLAAGSVRASAAQRDLSQEKPLLLNPFFDDPTKHITFEQEVAKSVGGSLHGEETIKTAGLNDEDLLESRRDWLATVSLMLEAYKNGNLPDPTKEKFVKKLKWAISVKGEFAAAVRANFGPAIRKLLKQA